MPHNLRATMAFVAVLISGGACGNDNSKAAPEDVGSAAYPEVVIPKSDVPDVSDQSDEGKVDDIEDGLVADPGEPSDETTSPEPDTVENDTAEDVLPPDAELVPDTDTGSDTSDDADETPLPPTMGIPVEVWSTEVSTSFGDISVALDDAGRVNTFWAARPLPTGPMELRLSRSDLDVNGFPDQLLVKSFGNVGTLDPDLAMDGKDYLMVWHDKVLGSPLHDIRFRRAPLDEIADPAQPANEVVVTSVGGKEELWRPYITRATVNTLFVIWQQKATVRLARSDDGGETFFAPKKISAPGSQAQVSAAAYVPPGRLVVAYQGKLAGGKQGIHVIMSDDLGDTFSAPTVNVGGMAPEGHHVGPSMTLATTGRTYLVWSRCDEDLCSGGSKPNGWLGSSIDGQMWEPPSELPVVSTKLQIRSGKGNTLYLSGLDNKDISAGKPGQPVFLTSPNLGETWWDPGYIPSEEGNVIMTYDIVANRKMGLLHIVWWEYIKKGSVTMGIRAATIGK